jgi:hypothetical protein
VPANDGVGLDDDNGAEQAKDSADDGPDQPPIETARARAGHAALEQDDLLAQ